jgi:hypothetical protein
VQGGDDGVAAKGLDTFRGFVERRREAERRREEVEDLGKMLRAMMDSRMYFEYDEKCLGGGHLATCCVLHRILREKKAKVCKSGDRYVLGVCTENSRELYVRQPGKKKAKVCKSGDRYVLGVCTENSRELYVLGGVDEIDADLNAGGVAFEGNDDEIGGVVYDAR